MRELSQYLLERPAPDDEAIVRCAWYKQNPDVNGPTRRQGALYASSGGLMDFFLKKELDLDPKEFHVDIVRRSGS